MDTILAITFNSPIKIPASAITKANKIAFLGSFATPCPLPKKEGTILSLAMACNILGAPRMLPRADDSVAPQMPATTSSGIQAVVKSTSESPINLL